MSKKLAAQHVFVGVVAVFIFPFQSGGKKEFINYVTRAVIIMWLLLMFREKIYTDRRIEKYGRRQFMSSNKTWTRINLVR